MWKRKKEECPVTETTQNMTLPSSNTFPEYSNNNTNIDRNSHNNDNNNNNNRIRMVPPWATNTGPGKPKRKTLPLHVLIKRTDIGVFIIANALIVGAVVVFGIFMYVRVLMTVNSRLFQYPNFFFSFVFISICIYRKYLTSN